MTSFETLMLLVVFFGFIDVGNHLKEIKSDIETISSDVACMEEDLSEMKPDSDDFIF